MSVEDDMARDRIKLTRRFFLFTVFGSFAIAFLTPADILSYHVAEIFVNVMAAIVPNVHNERLVGELSQVAQFHSSVRWALTPWALLAWRRLRVLWPAEVRAERERVLYSHKRWYLIFVVVVGPMIFIGLSFSPFDAELTRGERFQYGSRFGLGFVGAILFVGIPLAMSGWYLIVKDYRKWLFARKN